MFMKLMSYGFTLGVGLTAGYIGGVAFMVHMHEDRPYTFHSMMARQ